MKKYSIFTASACLALASLFANSAVAQCPMTPKKEIGIQLYSVKEDMKKNPAETMKTLAQTGYTFGELASYKDGKFYDMTPEEFKKMAYAAGLKILSSHQNRLLTADELKTKDFTEAMKWWETCIAANKAVGVKYIVMPYMPLPKTLKDLQTYCEYFDAVGKKCADNGIKFGYHNHKHEFESVDGKVAFDYMLSHTDPKNVFFEMDVYWTVMGRESPVDYFMKYPGRFKLLHIKDRAQVGQSGMVNFEAIFKNLKQAGTEYVVVEVEPKHGVPMEMVKESFDYLNNAAFVPSACPKGGCCMKSMKK